MLIRLATLEDLVALPRLEKSASELYRTEISLAWLADSGVMTRAEHERLILQGTTWVAEMQSVGLVGFLSAEVLCNDLHIGEISVDVGWQRKGIGKELIRNAGQYALAWDLSSLTLTTFSDVPWCAPAYSKLGFHRVQNPTQHLQAALEVDAAHGLPIERRVAMRLCLGEARPEFVFHGDKRRDQGTTDMT